MPCSGTDSFGRILEEKGFKWLSHGAVLRSELNKMGEEIIRYSMIELADKMRKEDGAGILSKKLIETMITGENYVIGNIRNPGEVDELRGRKGFVLVMVDASKEVRFERMKKRRRESDPLSWEGFLNLE